GVVCPALRDRRNVIHLMRHTRYRALLAIRTLAQVAVALENLCSQPAPRPTASALPVCDWLWFVSGGERFAFKRLGLDHAFPIHTHACSCMGPLLLAPIPDALLRSSRGCR